MVVGVGSTFAFISPSSSSASAELVASPSFRAYHSLFRTSTSASASASASASTSSPAPSPATASKRTQRRRGPHGSAISPHCRAAALARRRPAVWAVLDGAQQGAGRTEEAGCSAATPAKHAAAATAVRMAIMVIMPRDH